MMVLVSLIAVPLIGGLLAWVAARASAALARWIAVLALVEGLGASLGIALGGPSSPGRWLLEGRAAWIPRFGISFHLALDGLSLILIGLTFFLGLLSVIVSWSQIRERVGFYHFNLLWVLAGVIGVFLAVDLFLFYFFWELMLVPMYFLIGIWGHERRAYAAVKFFIFTQAGGVLMLLSILGLVWLHRAATGVITFDYTELLGSTHGGSVATWLMLGFLAAFLIKLPAVPFHTWLPDAHTQAPTAGSVLLAGLLLKTGAYGILRFAIPLFPDAAARLAPAAMILGVVGILYGAVLAFAQHDLKRLVAYTSVSHLGFVLVGAFAWNQVALEGVTMQMVAHGLSTGGLFVIVGFLNERLHTRDMRDMGGLWALAPRMGFAAMFFAMASLGLPGLGNFVAEFLVLLGTFRADRTLAILATLGLVAATVYSLWIVQRAFHGEPREGAALADLSLREMGVVIVMMVALVWLGLYPQPVLDLAGPALDGLRHAAAAMALGG